MISQGNVPVGGLMFPLEGVGTELHKLLKEMEFDVFAGCDCASKIHQMNLWGVAGCRENRSVIIQWLIEAAVLVDVPQCQSTEQMCGVLVDRAILITEAKHENPDNRRSGVSRKQLSEVREGK